MRHRERPGLGARTSAALSTLLALCTAACLHASRDERAITASATGPASPPPARVALGRALFFDTRLSRSGTLACATCHDPRLGLADGLPVARGHAGQPLPRHTPSLVNVGLGQSFFWDGRAASLEEQALQVIESPDEFDTTLAALTEVLRRDPWYPDAFAAAFPAGLTGANILAALADFERSLLAFDSPYDRWRGGDEHALAPAALRGLALFEGRARCTRCHAGPNFTDGGFHNTGVPTEDPGRIRVQRNVPFRTRPYPFFGNYKAFKTPTLRNVALSPPYFHDGSAATLAEVVRHYDVGGTSLDTYGRSPDVRPLGLNEREIADLVAFLEALTSPLAVVPPDP